MQMIGDCRMFEVKSGDVDEIWRMGGTNRYDGERIERCELAAESPAASNSVFQLKV